MNTTLTVRRLLVDLDTPLPRRWCGGDAFRTAFFNALSMSFPAGEQLFIDSVKKGMAELPPEQRERFAVEVQGFIGQEATHRRIHQRFNAHLLDQGLRNRYEERILSRRPLLESLDTRNWLAVTAATEHFTAIFSEHMLTHPEQLQGAEPRLRDMWLWHCSEETEHRSTAFDLYHALGGKHEWRCRVFKAVAWDFSRELLRQTALNLWHDSSWWRPSTWVSAWRTLFGRRGMVRLGYAPLRRYLREDFHPSQADGRGAEAWLAAHAELAPPVRPAAV
jgi:predicted metal-dependent hydrolase